MIGWQVIGADKLAHQFAAAAAQSVARVPTALAQCGLLVVRTAKQKAPVDTGFLRSAIQMSPPTQTHVDVVAHASYSAYQELGTSRMKAQPFMRPALDENREEFERILGNEVVDASLHTVGIIGTP